jgi:hypothetical protein
MDTVLPFAKEMEVPVVVTVTGGRVELRVVEDDPRCAGDGGGIREIHHTRGRTTNARAGCRYRDGAGGRNRTAVEDLKADELALRRQGYSVGNQASCNGGRDRGRRMRLLIGGVKLAGLRHNDAEDGHEQSAKAPRAPRWCTLQGQETSQRIPVGAAR